MLLMLPLLWVLTELLPCVTKLGGKRASRPFSRASSAGALSAIVPSDSLGSPVHKNRPLETCCKSSGCPNNSPRPRSLRLLPPLLPSLLRAVAGATSIHAMLPSVLLVSLDSPRGTSLKAAASTAPSGVSHLTCWPRESVGTTVHWRRVPKASPTNRPAQLNKPGAALACASFASAVRKTTSPMRTSKCPVGSREGCGAISCMEVLSSPTRSPSLRLEGF